MLCMSGSSEAGGKTTVKNLKKHATNSTVRRHFADIVDTLDLLVCADTSRGIPRTWQHDHKVTQDVALRNNIADIIAQRQISSSSGEQKLGLLKIHLQQNHANLQPRRKLNPGSDTLETNSATCFNTD